MKAGLRWVDEHVYETAFAVSLLAVLASMVLSTVVGFTPCDLCWYQRIAMFPIPIVLAAGLYRADKHAYLYAVPLVVVGAVLALYHSLLQWGIITENVLECSAGGTACAEPEILWFGFLTIPFGAFVSFCGIGWLLYRARSVNGHPKPDQGGQRAISNILLGSIIATFVAVALLKLLNIV
jgi:disulfide bond formation protein DsbB